MNHLRFLYVSDSRHCMKQLQGYYSLRMFRYTYFILIETIVKNRSKFNLTQIRHGIHYLCKLTCFLDMAARTFRRASFNNGALVCCVGLVTTDQSRFVFRKKATNLFSDRGILVGWQAHGTFQSKSCHQKKNP